ncbi:DUF1461 domain-containing protein [Thiomicrorhabdus sp. ZW0627]|uniref:lipoprotein intramolecular transacylase Lit n=1 Tax=Thiomicrorhabdus sp. ZW0627 TaxID=3039774 RepID=UPI0024372E4E|nr:DUF1461 domain-containing protein [Thiomicrorhabdus sp. ZW0627]MDG6773887.1 DUF1461 domain-containing protein [Thiomicrorhabdus sp. ZW0627]
MQSHQRNLFRKRTGLFSSNKNDSLHYLRSFLWVWLTFILALYASWMILAKADFLYGVWYDYAGIGEHIDHYAPQNRFRHGFEDTDADTRKQLFAGIVNAIHNHGEGLKELSYPHPTLPVRIPLLHKAEIDHLTDVALLLDFLKRLGWGLLLLWAALTTYLLMMKRSFPTAKLAWGNIGIGLLLLAAILVLYGPKQVFYQLHMWVFPANHHWFFYYQDSLMSTMMKAPDLFAYISTSLLLVGLIIFFLLIKLFNRHKTI